MVTAQRLLRIGIMGAHSTGKTLLMRRIEMELRGLDIPVARTGRLGRRAALVPLPKMRHHTVDSTRWIIATSVADEVAAAASLGNDAPVRVVLADRACWDAISYYRAAQEWNNRTVPRAGSESLYRLAAAHAPYDLLLATVLDPDVPVRPKHDHDARYRTLVDHHTHALLRAESLPSIPVTGDHGSQRRAIEKALQLCCTEAPV